MFTSKIRVCGRRCRRLRDPCSLSVRSSRTSGDGAARVRTNRIRRRAAVVVISRKPMVREEFAVAAAGRRRYGRGFGCRLLQTGRRGDRRPQQRHDHCGRSLHGAFDTFGTGRATVAMVFAPANKTYMP